MYKQEVQEAKKKKSKKSKLVTIQLNYMYLGKRWMHIYSYPMTRITEKNWKIIRIQCCTYRELFFVGFVLFLLWIF